MWPGKKVHQFGILPCPLESTVSVCTKGPFGMQSP